MPDKRQTSKQRRAARNRASRQARAARRTNAVTPSTASAGSTGSAGATGAAAAGTSANGGAAAVGARRGLFGGGTRRPGDRAILVGFGLTITSAFWALFQRIDVDDRGEPLPRTFQAVAIQAREAFTGEPVPDATTTLLDAYGPGVLFFIALPVAIAAFAVWANRRADRSRLLTFVLLAMAGAVILNPVGTFFFPTLIALAIASFQVRKADLPARTAEKVAPRRKGRGDVIDAEANEVDDVAPGDGGAGDDRGLGNDPLAELEAEIEAEKQSREAEEQNRKAEGGDGSGGSLRG